MWRCQKILAVECTLVQLFQWWMKLKASKCERIRICCELWQWTWQGEHVDCGKMKGWGWVRVIMDKREWVGPTWKVPHKHKTWESYRTKIKFENSIGRFLQQIITGVCRKNQKTTLESELSVQIKHMSW